jgi:hypothetical protein
MYLLQFIPNLRADSVLLSPTFLFQRLSLVDSGADFAQPMALVGERSEASESSEWPLISSVYYCCITTGSGICSLSHRLSTPLQRLLQRCVWPAVSQCLGCAMATTDWCGEVWYSSGAARVCSTGRSAVERPLP